MASDVEMGDEEVVFYGNCDKGILYIHTSKYMNEHERTPHE